MSSVNYHVPEMHCGACEASIRGALADVDGVESVEIELNLKRVSVAFDEGKTSAVAVRARIERAGFDVA